LHLHPVRVRKHGLRLTYTWGLGGISFFLFLVLGVTGGLLMFEYVPSVERAYADIVRIQTSRVDHPSGKRDPSGSLFCSPRRSTPLDLPPGLC